ncbi:MAG: hypothetical protein D6715_10475 [Calditrichaeota bacterium]|nr:MAG: hypothetical protein D6715_10475 [Calditrichota bacterium]
MNRATRIRLMGWLMSLIVLLGWSAIPTRAVAQQDIRSSLFKDADDFLASARKAGADVLAPKNFGQAMKYYQEAERDLKKGKNLDDIRKKLNAAVSYFNKALEDSKLAEVTFRTTIKARNDALKAEAPQYSKETWRRAEDKFREAATELEDGDVNAAKRKAADAETMYRKAELEAIKASYLTDTWKLLEEADKMDVKDVAPKTLQRAKELAKQAEKELNENRYDTDVARDLAQQAKYEAKHAIYLARTIREMKKNKNSFEDLLLVAEQPLRDIAAALDINAEFDEGFGKVANQIREAIAQMQDSLNQLNQELTANQEQIAALQDRVKELEDKLGGIAQERSALVQRMEALAKIREQFNKVERLFGRDEAMVLRQGNDVIIRLIGLNFAPGKAVIEPQYFSLLTKVQEAIRTFPNCTVTIEGHTDSHGSDAANLRLSQERAEAVKAYLLANMGLEPSRINAVGFGESRPIASNETPEGRAKNRRIDIVIHPEIPGTE